MKQIFNLIVFLLSASLVNAQYLTPVAFEQSPIWNHYSLVPELNDSQQGFYFFPEYICDNDHVYISGNITDNLIMQGVLTECLNLKTGEMKWQHSRYTNDITKRFAAKNIYIKDNNLILPLFINNDEPNQFPFYGRTVRGEYTLDIQNGIVIDSFFTDQRDTSIRRLGSPHSISPFGNAETHILPINDSIFSYVNATATSAFSRYKQITLNELGHAIDSTHIDLPVPTQYHELYSKKIDDNRLLLTGSGYRAGEDELSFCYIAVTDYQLNPILDPIDIGSVLHSKPADFRLESVNKDYFIVLVRLPEGDGKYVVLDYTGKKISEYKVRTEDFQKVNFGRRAAILGDNQFVYVDIEFLSNKYQLNFYINNSTNEMVLKKSVVTTSENDRITLMQMGITPDKNILLNFIHNNYTLNLDPIPNWSLWTLFDPVELGLTTSTKDEHIANKLTLYPNPTTGLVTIDHLDTPAKVDIYDLNGSLVQTKDNVTSEVNIDKLPSGIYILNIINHQINERHKIIKME